MTDGGSGGSARPSAPGTGPASASEPPAHRRHGCGWYVLWYLFLVAAIGTLGMGSEAVAATTSGHDPDLGAHPVRATALVVDWKATFCRRGGCQYDERITFTAGGEAQAVTLHDLVDRPTIGASQTVWYPEGRPSAAQTEGPHSAVYYWIATSCFAAATAVLVVVLLGKRRRSAGSATAGTLPEEGRR